MFWKAARKRYAGVTADDPDVRLFLERSTDFQHDAYKGLAAWIQDEGHRWIAARTPPGRILEIGFGAGRHDRFFEGDRSTYFVSEYSSVHTGTAPWKAAQGRALRCDARRLPFPGGAFDAVLSIYNLEHIEDLAAVLMEVHRVLVPGGRFLVGLPCEGGLAWNVGRELTTRPHFQRRFGINYDKVIAFEHVRDYDGVVAQLEGSGLFDVRARVFLPFRLPSSNLNLIGCLDLCVRKDPGSRS